MINNDKWINSLPRKNIKFNSTENQLDHDKWTSTIAKKSNAPNSIKKYTLMTTIFVCGLLFVSTIKNETRNLQKEINNLKTEINLIEFNLDQAILDSEVLNSPENISLLAKEHLNIDLTVYKPSQIVELNSNLKKENNEITKEQDFKKEIKKKVSKKIEEKKQEISELKTLYSNPKTIPQEIKKEVASKIKEKQNQLSDLYNSPKEFFTLEKVGKWSAVQIVKVFLGMPIFPGR